MKTINPSLKKIKQICISSQQNFAKQARECKRNGQHVEIKEVKKGRFRGSPETGAMYPVRNGSGEVIFFQAKLKENKFSKIPSDTYKSGKFI
jgi:hypothetical protein